MWLMASDFQKRVFVLFQTFSLTFTYITAKKVGEATFFFQLKDFLIFS